MSQAAATRQRFLNSRRGLEQVRADMAIYGVHFESRTVKKRLAGGRVETRLLAILRGRVDSEARGRVDSEGRMTVDASRHSGYQAAAFALTLVQPMYPNAVTTGRGGIAPDGRWACEVWLNPSDAQLKEIEDAAARAGL